MPCNLTFSTIFFLFPIQLCYVFVLNKYLKSSVVIGKIMSRCVFLLFVDSVAQSPAEIIPNIGENGKVLIVRCIFEKSVCNNFIRNVFMPIKEYLDIGTPCSASNVEKH